MPNNLQDEAEDCLGEMWVSNVVINQLEVEELLRVNNIDELNPGCDINLMNDTTIYGDLGVSGCLYLSQPLINLTNKSGMDDGDIGFYSAYQDPLGVTYYTGLVRDASDGKYKLFDKATNIVDICGEIDFTGITWSDLELGRLDIKRPLYENSLKIADAKYGDLMVGISGTYQTLPLGLEDQVLTVNYNSPLGVTWEYEKNGNLKYESGSWIERISSYGYTRVSSNLTLINDNIYTRVFKKKYKGTRSYSVINEIEDGPMGYFELTKSRRGIDGHSVKLTGLTSYAGGLKTKWSKNVNIELGKCTDDSDGDYLAIANYDPDCAPIDIRQTLYEEVNLIGITGIEINNSMKGNFLFHIDNELEGPTGIFYMSKGKEDIEGHIVRVSHSPSIDFNKLKITWPANSGIFLNKTKNSLDGNYRIIPIHDQYITEKIVTLTGNSPTTEIIVDDYERVVTIVTVESVDTDGAAAIFTISKNHIDNKPHIVRVTSTSSGGGWDRLEIIGVDPPSINNVPINCLLIDGLEIIGVPRKCHLATAPSSENIELVWDENDRLRVKKDNGLLGSEIYDGEYKIRIYDYFPC